MEEQSLKSEKMFIFSGNDEGNEISLQEPSLASSSVSAKSDVADLDPEQLFTNPTILSGAASEGGKCQNDFFVQGCTEYQKELILKLSSSELGQEHLFDAWEGYDADRRRDMVKHLEQMDKLYPGGLVGYIEKARSLLKDSKEGKNPYERWEPSVPTGAAFDFGTNDYRAMEKQGIPDLGRVGFVLVAGGLGERLGYKDGIKLQLPTEMCTETCYLQLYIEYILAIQKKYAPRFTKLPLCIMVSKETLGPTTKLLRDNNCFGLFEGQIYMIQQGVGVPTLMNNAGRLHLDEKTKLLETKPHGHGDVHNLLHRSGVAKSWLEQYDTKWIMFLQDTNGLAFHTLPLLIGVSKKYNLLMNSLAVPRKAKQAIGGIAKLTNKDTGEERTLNVEYNQLDPLLRATKEYPDGDVNDATTGFSPFPGNINQILFNARDYVKVLERTRGILPEFINPKYADETKTTFKKPTRLECMMQDFPVVLTGEETKRVGFTGVSADMCFSPLKNTNPEGAKIQRNDAGPPATAATAEADQYAAFQKMFIVRGIDIIDPSDHPVYQSNQLAQCLPPEQTWEGITIKTGPQIVLKPDFVTCPTEMKAKFPYPEKIKITNRSSLVVHGSGVVIESLNLDGALIIKPAKEDERITIRDVIVRNQGWVKERIDHNDMLTSTTQFEQMRGYRLVKKGTRELATEPMDFCGEMATGSGGMCTIH